MAAWRAFNALSRGDVGVVRTITHAEAVWDLSRWDWPEESTYHGRDGAVRFNEHWLNQFSELNFDVFSTEEVEPGVIFIHVHLRGIGSASGAEVGRDVFELPLRHRQPSGRSPRYLGRIFIAWIARSEPPLRTIVTTSSRSALRAGPPDGAQWSRFQPAQVVQFHPAPTPGATPSWRSFGSVSKAPGCPAISSATEDSLLHDSPLQHRTTMTAGQEVRGRNPKSPRVYTIVRAGRAWS
jgi:hypothetical protein